MSLWNIPEGMTQVDQQKGRFDGRKMRYSWEIGETEVMGNSIEMKFGRENLGHIGAQKGIEEK